MKIDKAYKLIFNEIIKPKDYQRRFDIDEDNIFITPNSFYGFVFAKKDLPFNLEMIKQANKNLDLLSVVKPENRFKRTNNFVLLDKHGTINVLKNDNRKIYVNQKYLQYFEDYAEFYQEKDLNIVVAVENGQVVGAIMPIRHKEDKDNAETN